MVREPEYACLNIVSDEHCLTELCFRWVYLPESYEFLGSVVALKIIAAFITVQRIILDRNGYLRGVTRAKRS